VQASSGSPEPIQHAPDAASATTGELFTKKGAWMHTLVDDIRTHGLSYTFWCLNPNSGDTGGLLEDNWTTVNPAKW
jgi:hypothetical protein